MLVLAGFALALCLSLLAMMRISFDGGLPKFTYRELEQWDSTSSLFVTSHKFPWGSVLPPQSQSLTTTTTGAEPGDEATAPAGVDPAHLTSLAGLYARLAVSDQVLRIIYSDGVIPGVLAAEPLAAGKDNSGAALPMIGLSAISSSEGSAHELARRHVNAFIQFIEERQNEAEIASTERVVVEIVQQPARPVLVEPRKKTRSVIVFLAVMTAVIGLAFVLENLRPRVRSIPPQELRATASRSA